ncbi:MAG: TolC family protein, partial [Acetobacteraceae bacterium]
ALTISRKSVLRRGGDPGRFLHRQISTTRASSDAMCRSRDAYASREAVRGEGLQAGLWPNPEASLTVENFGGTGGRGSYRGFEQTETTLGLSQRLELGGKRTARLGFAGQNESVAGLDYQAARLDLARAVVTALADATAAARIADVEQERLRLAGETLRAVRGRVEAGKEALLQARRAEVARTTAEIAAARANREAEAALNHLAVLMGVARADLAPRQTWFEETGPEPRPPVPADPFARLANNPDLARLDAVIAQRRADLALQRANAVPDITLQGGVRRFQEGRETAFVAGVSVPLPFNDRNQGGIARANADLTRAEADAERGRQTLAVSLIATERSLELAWRAVQSLRRTALPAASQAAGFASRGYAEGKFGFLEVLDAQRALFDTRAQLNDALREFHTRRAEVERLRGQESGSLAMTGAR